MKDMHKDVDPAQFFAHPNAEFASNAYDSAVYAREDIAQLEKMGLTVQIRLDEPETGKIFERTNYSATMVISLPNRELSGTHLTMLKHVAAIVSLRPDEITIEKDKLVLWWD